MKNSQKVIAFTAPSGAGKTTIVKALLKSSDRFVFSVSATTRIARENEKNGLDYHFISEETFKKKIHEDAFIEWEEVYQGLFYGTLKEEVRKNHANGLVTIFDIDVKGALKLKKFFKDDILVIFVQPPSIEALKDRLRNRKTESVVELNKRLQKSEEELSFAGKFDVIVVNDKLEDALKEVKQLVTDFTGVEMN